MKPKTKEMLIGVGLLIGLIVVFGLLSKWAFSGVWEFISSADPNVAAALIATFGTVVTTAIVVIAGQIYAKRAQAEDAHRERKVEIYSKFVDMAFEAVKKGWSESEENKEYRRKIRSKFKPDSSKTIDYFFEVRRDILLWASPGVIQAFNVWLSDHESERALIHVENLFREFRKDLGLPTWSLNKGDLIRLFLKAGEDINEILR